MLCVFKLTRAPGGSEGSGLNKLNMPGSVRLKTHFHKGSGDF